MSTDPQGSVIRWIGALNLGDAETAEHLGERYSGALVRLARAKIGVIARFEA